MTSPAFGDYQLEIYGAGLRGVIPTFPMGFAELEARAAQALPPPVLSYVAGGAGSEHTQRANVSAFRRWGLMPRMFVGAAKRDMSVELFGMTLPSPLFMAPIGVIGLCAQDGHGDLATAAAAARTGVPMLSEPPAGGSCPRLRLADIFVRILVHRAARQRSSGLDTVPGSRTSRAPARNGHQGTAG